MVDITQRKPDLNASDPYLVLGVPKTAEQAAIKRAYFALIREYPPETHPDTFKIIRGAYEKIKSAARRTETDIFLPKPPPPYEPTEDLALEQEFQHSDVLVALRSWGELGRRDFSDDFQEIDLS